MTLFSNTMINIKAKMTVFVLFCTIISSFFLSSCVTIPTIQEERVELTKYPYSNASERPELWVTYYPAFSARVYQPRTNVTFTGKVTSVPELLADVRAVKDHDGAWTDEAMQQDINDMQSVGFAGCLLLLTPEELLDRDRLLRIHRFITLCASRSPRFKIGLGIYAQNRLELGSGNFAQFLQQNGFTGLAHSLTLPPYPPSLLPVIFDARTIRLNQQNYEIEKQFDIRQMRTISDGIGGTVNPSASFRLVRAARCNIGTEGISWKAQHQWIIPRGDGSFFSQSLRKAFLNRTAIICIHSWNGIMDGSFIEPNNYDQQALLDVLYAEMDCLENLRLEAEATR